MVKCPKCGKEMKIRQGRYSKFYGCVNYPACNGTKPLTETTNIETKKQKTETPVVKTKTRIVAIVTHCETLAEAELEKKRLAEEDYDVVVSDDGLSIVGYLKGAW